MLNNETLLDRLLDSEGGISEFIIPLVLNGHITEGVYWVKPSWSHQIANGTYKFAVGDVCGSSDCPLGVTAHLDYYFDDGLVYGEDELHNVSNLTLTVCDPNTYISYHSSAAPYILDICLDYFHTVNPFLKELLYVFDVVDKQCSDLMLSHYVNIFNSLRYRTSEQLSAGHRRTMRANFMRVFRYCCTRCDESLPLIDGHGIEHSRESSLRHILLTFITPSLTSTDSVNAFMQLVDKLNDMDSLNVAEMRRTLADVGCLCLLPDSTQPGVSIAAYDDIKADICIAVNEMVQCLHGTIPSVICIARSDGDGYTPAEIVDFIQEEVLCALRRKLETSGALLRVYDIRDNPVAQSRSMLFAEVMSEQRADAASDLRSTRKRTLLEASGYQMSFDR